MELRTETYPLFWISGFLSSISRYIQIDWIRFFSLYMLAVEFLSKIWGCNFHVPDQMVQKKEVCCRISSEPTAHKQMHVYMHVTLVKTAYITVLGDGVVEFHIKQTILFFRGIFGRVQMS